jgi:hypothetical protein
MRHKKERGFCEKVTTGNRKRQVPVVNIADMGCERIRTHTNAYQLQKQNQTQKHKQTHTQQATRTDAGG